MVFSNEDKTLIKNLRKSEGYSARKYIKEFPDKNWNRKGLDYLLKKFCETGTVEWKVGSGKRRSGRTMQNINAVEDLIVSVSVKWGWFSMSPSRQRPQTGPFAIPKIYP